MEACKIKCLKSNNISLIVLFLIAFVTFLVVMFTYTNDSISNYLPSKKQLKDIDVEDRYALEPSQEAQPSRGLSLMNVFRQGPKDYLDVSDKTSDEEEHDPDDEIL